MAGLFLDKLYASFYGLFLNNFTQVVQHIGRVKENDKYDEKWKVLNKRQNPKQIGAFLNLEASNQKLSTEIVETHIHTHLYKPFRIYLLVHCTLFHHFLSNRK